MHFKKVHQIIRVQIKRLKKHANSSWYAPLIGLLAALDNLVIIIPNDGILISSSMLNPKRWFLFAMSITIGSTIGAMSLVYIVEILGLPWILNIYPGVNETQTWIWSLEFFEKYGLLCVFFVSLGPLMQQPIIVLASLAHTPYMSICAAVFAGRLIKFLILSYVASHSPRLLSKFWGLKHELDDVDVHL
jgi:membrane protein YqaA with SNARE-associated domain